LSQGEHSTWSGVFDGTITETQPECSQQPTENLGDSIHFQNLSESKPASGLPSHASKKGKVVWSLPRAIITVMSAFMMQQEQRQMTSRPQLAKFA